MKLNRQIDTFIYFSAWCTLRQPSFHLAFALFYFVLFLSFVLSFLRSLMSSTKTSVNYAKKDDDFLASVQIYVIIFLRLVSFSCIIFFSFNNWFWWSGDFSCSFFLLFTPFSEQLSSCPYYHDQKHMHYAYINFVHQYMCRANAKSINKCLCPKAFL